MLLFAGAVTVSAQTGGSYNLSWWTVDGGGAALGGGYALVGTAGQADAGPALSERSPCGAESDVKGRRV